MSEPPSQVRVTPATARLYRLENYHFTRDLPPDTRDILKEIFASWQESAQAEALVRGIIDRSPDTLGVRIVAYRFYFYRRRCLEAAHWALACIEWLADALELPRDWRHVTPEMAEFARWEVYPRLWLQSLVAYAYNLARLGRQEEALEALAKVEQLDVHDKLGAPHLRQVFTRPLPDAGMLFPKPQERQVAPVTLEHPPQSPEQPEPGQ
ncbi:MAG: hypothetical protein LWW84_16075 [Azovibrio sp.]|nr:hypothetical protein [Azovibrio sp.]